MNNKTAEELRNKLAAEIQKNGGDQQLLGYQFGARWPENKGSLYPREQIAKICEEQGFKNAAKVARECTPEQALVDAVRARGAILAADAAKNLEKHSSGNRKYIFHINPLYADKDDGHLRAFGVYREQRSESERSSSFERLGARIYATSEQVVASAPLDGAPDASAEIIAAEITRHAGVLLEFLDNTLMGKVLLACYAQAGAIVHLCEGLRLCLDLDAGSRLVDLIIRLKSEAQVPVSFEPRFRGGLSEAHASESLTRSMVQRIDQLCRQLAGESGRTVRPLTLIRRQDELNAMLDDVQRYASLLDTFKQNIVVKVESLKEQYLAAQRGRTLQLPDWALEEPSSDANLFASVTEDAVPESDRAAVIPDGDVDATAPPPPATPPPVAPTTAQRRSALDDWA
jgi:hypothetical protein